MLYKRTLLRTTFQNLRFETQRTALKDTNLKKAMQFQLLRHSRYYLLKSTFRALALQPKKEAELKSNRDGLVRAFRLKQVFRSLKEVVSEEAQHDASIIQEHMRNRYFSMWRRQLNQEKAERIRDSEIARQREVEMQKRILGCM